jgi:hypothetical protein
MNDRTPGFRFALILFSAAASLLLVAYVTAYLALSDVRMMPTAAGDPMPMRNFKSHSAFEFFTPLRKIETAFGGYISAVPMTSPSDPAVE